MSTSKDIQITMGRSPALGRLIRKIEIALQKGVQVIKLDVYNRGYIVPETIFKAKSLTELYVKGFKFMNNERLLPCDNIRRHLSWFLKLHQLVSDLSPSNVTLRLTCDFEIESYKYMGNIPNFATNPIIVGKVILIIQGVSSTRADSDVVDGLFWACQPRAIILSIYNGNREFMEQLYKKLIKDRRNQRFYYMPKFWQHDLKKCVRKLCVNMVFYEIVMCELEEVKLCVVYDW
ncbi:hypothetical protein ACH5RR_012269 [Cinchona calisaya]|uniref:Uncharacterized protein n=1 Tax=Cinchona calisaya TaxID=153742 RepID=A0ABD3AD45_9GENT